MNKRVRNSAGAQEQKREKSSKEGATASRISSLTLFRAWWRHHGDSCRQSLWRLLQTPVQSLLTWMAIAIALTLPISLYLALQNVQQLGQGWQDNAQMSAFLNKQAKPQAIDRLVDQLGKDKAVASLELVTADSALREFQQHSGLGDVLASLDDNPLPALLVIQPSADINTPDKLEDLAARLQQQVLIESVQVDMGWLQRLYELLALGQRIILALGIVLIVSVLLIIGNTLRLAIENRRDEIVVVKMVGGTDGFVRRPFLYTGLWYGLGGGFFAVILLFFLNFWLASPIANISSLYNSEYVLTGLDLGLALGVILISGFLGWLGAWIAVARHLRSIQPS